MMFCVKIQVMSLSSQEALRFTAGIIVNQMSMATETVIHTTENEMNIVCLFWFTRPQKHLKEPTF